MLLFKPKHVSHEQRILKHLKKCGKYGAYGHELARQSIGGLAWHRRITDLRKSGEHIITIRETKGNFRYYWVNE